MTQVLVFNEIYFVCLRIPIIYRFADSAFYDNESATRVVLRGEPVTTILMSYRSAMPPFVIHLTFLSFLLLI